MWSPRIEEQCPLMERLQSIRKALCYISFSKIPSVEKARNEMETEDETAEKTLGMEIKNDSLDEEIIWHSPATVSGCDPVYYYDIPLAACLFSRILTQIFFPHVTDKGKRIEFLSRPTLGATHDPAKVNDSRRKNSFLGLVEPSLVKSITTMTSHHFPNKHLGVFLLQKLYNCDVWNDSNELSIVAVGYSDSSLALYLFHPNIAETLLPMFSEDQPMKTEKSFLLIAEWLSEERGDILEDKDAINVLALSDLRSEEKENILFPFVLVSGTKQGRVVIWLLEMNDLVHEAASDIIPKLCPIPLEQSLSNPSPIVTVTIVDAGISSSSSDESGVGHIDLLVLVTHESGLAHQWKVNIPVSSKEKVNGSHEAVFLDLKSSAKGIISQRRRLWNPDPLLGPVVNAELCRLGYPVANTFTHTSVLKYVIFTCYSGVLVLEVLPQLRLIFRQIFTPPTLIPRCSSCLFNTLSLQWQFGTQTSCMKEYSGVQPQNLLVSFDTFGSEENVQKRGLQLITFFQDPMTHEWIVWENLAMTREKEETLGSSTFPFFKTMIFLNDTQLLLTLDDTGKSWLGIEERKKMTTMNGFGINIVFLPFNNCYDSCWTTHGGELTSLFIHIHGPSPMTSLLLNAQFSMIAVTRWTTQQLTTVWHKSLQLLESGRLDTPLDLLFPRVDAITVLISYLGDVIVHMSVSSDMSRTGPGECQHSKQEVVEFCSTSLHFILNKTKVKNDSLVFIYDLITFFNYRYRTGDKLLPSSENTNVVSSLCDGSVKFSALDLPKVTLNLPGHDVEKNQCRASRGRDLFREEKTYGRQEAFGEEKRVAKGYASLSCASQHGVNTLQNSLEDTEVTPSFDSLPGWTSEAPISIHQRLSEVLISLLISNAILSVAEALSFVLPDTWLSSHLPEAFPVLLSRILSSPHLIPSGCSLTLRCLTVLNRRIISTTLHLGSLILCQDALTLNAVSNLDELEACDCCLTHDELFHLVEQLLTIHRFKNSHESFFLDDMLTQLSPATPEELFLDQIGYLVWTHRHASSSFDRLLCVFLNHMENIEDIFGLECCLRVVLHLLQSCSLGESRYRLYDTAEILLKKAKETRGFEILELYVWKAFLSNASWYASPRRCGLDWAGRIVCVLERLPNFCKDRYERLFLVSSLGRKELLKALVDKDNVSNVSLDKKCSPLLTLPKLALGLAMMEHSNSYALERLRSELFDVCVPEKDTKDGVLDPDAFLETHKSLSSVLCRVFQALAWFFTHQSRNYSLHFFSTYVSTILIHISPWRSLYLTCHVYLKFLTFQLQLLCLRQTVQEVVSERDTVSTRLPCDLLLADVVRILSQYMNVLDLDLSVNQETLNTLRHQWIQKKKKAHPKTRGASTAAFIHTITFSNTCHHKRFTFKNDHLSTQRHLPSEIQCSQLSSNESWSTQPQGGETPPQWSTQDFYAQQLNIQPEKPCGYILLAPGMGSSSSSLNSWCQEMINR